MIAMILAAGLGTRMRPLTDNCPKPLLKVAGKPLIEHHIEKLVAAGFQHIVINHAYLGHMIEEALGDGSRWGINIHYSPEEQALETGGGIFNALPIIQKIQNETDQTGDHSRSPFLLINGDVWTSWNLEGVSDVISTIKQSENVLAHLWLVENPDHNPDGDFELLTDSGFGKSGLIKSASGPEAVCKTFSGISVLTPELFAGCTGGAFPLAPLLREAMSDDCVTGHLLKEEWIDVGTPERLAYTEQVILK